MDPYLKIAPGEPAPNFRIETTDGDWIEFRSPHRQLSLLNFFIIKCPHCRDGLNFFKKELWEPLQAMDVSLLCIGRDHTLEEVREFKQSKAFPFTMAADPGRKVYDLFAMQKVPRNFLVDREGKIVHQTRGFNEEEYRKTIALIDKLSR